MRPDADTGDGGFAVAAPPAVAAKNELPAADGAEQGAKPGELGFPGTARYQVRRRLGSGGMGVVYEAWDQSRARPVALKTLRLLDAGAVYLLKQEFRVLSDVRHPNLVELHELVAEEGHWFFTMELVDGVDFLSWVRSGTSPTPLVTLDEPIASSPPNVADLVSDEVTGEAPEITRVARLPVASNLDMDRLCDGLIQLVDGLSALHALGKLHRDVKPSNVMVTPEGRVVVLDFGLAIEVSARDTLQSIDQHVLGTPEYMSPEQARLATLGPAADWYSVGVMLFEALTGGLPFSGTPLEIIMERERRDAPKPDTFVHGLDPLLTDLCCRLLARSPKARPTGDEIRSKLVEITHSSGRISRTSEPRSLRAIEPRTSQLVGREEALSALREAFLLSRKGDGRAVVVHVVGESGVGKTALLRAFLDEVGSRRALTFPGRCHERESLPYKALDTVIDELSRHLRRLTRLEVEALLPRDAMPLRRLFPVLGRIEAIANAKQSFDEGRVEAKELRRRAVLALREMLSRLSDRRPLVIAIDDLQWGDVDSVTLLGEILRAPAPPPIVLICAYRGSDRVRSAALAALDELPAIAIRSVLRDLRTSSTTGRRQRDEACVRTEIELGPLGLDDTVSLARALMADSVDPSLPRSVAEESGGNPFLLHELVRFLGEQEPTSKPFDLRTSIVASSAAEARWITLDELVSARLSQLGAPSRRLLEVLATATRPISPDIAAKAAELSESFSALDALRRAHFVRTAIAGEAETIEPSHERLRAILTERMRPERLAETHLRLATTLEAEQADPESLATHFRAAGARWKASHYAARAAESAASALAFDRAAQLYRLALELAPTNAPESRLHRERLGDALANAGRLVESAAEYLLAAEGAEPSVMWELHRIAAQYLLQSGHVDEGLAVVATVLKALGLELPKTPRRAILRILIHRARLRLRGLDYKIQAEGNCQEEDLRRLDTLWTVSTGLGLVDPIRAAEFQTRHLLLALKVGEPVRLTQAFVGEACFSSTRGQGALGRTEYLVKLANQTASHGGVLSKALALAAEGYLAFHKADWLAAKGAFDRSIQVLQNNAAASSWEAANVQLFWLHCLVFLGRLDELSSNVPRRLDDAASRGDRLSLTLLRVGPASLCWLLEDDAEGGRHDVHDAISTWSQSGFHLQHWYALVSETQIDLYQGRGVSALRRIQATMNQVQSAMFMRIARVRLETLWCRARAALAACTEGGQDMAALLQIAERDAAEIEHVAIAYALPVAHLIRAGIKHRRGDLAATRQSLEAALAGFSTLSMSLHVAVVQRRLSRMESGPKAAKLLETSHAFMRREGVRRPSRLSAMIATGFQRA